MADLTDPNVADLLVDIGAVEIRPNQPFAFASGLLSPVYCDNRMFLSRPVERNAMLAHLYRAIENAAGDGWDAVAGVATAGIPFAAWVAMHFDKPMVYIRPSEKDHGRGHRIEGGLPPGRSVILIEDLITTGGSALAAISALRDAGLTCTRCFSIFDYGFSSAAQRFQAGGVTQVTLTNTQGLLDALRRSNRASEEAIAQVQQWHRDVNAGSTPAPA